jgi:hypothetical protein
LFLLSVGMDKVPRSLANAFEGLELETNAKRQ